MGKRRIAIPIYEYDCGSCGHEFEELVFGSDADVVCPECGAADVKRQLSAFAFKSGGKFVSSMDASCDNCKPSPGG